MNEDKPLSKQIKPFGFMLKGSEVKGVIPCLSYSKDLSGIEYRPFIDYRTGLTSDRLSLSTKEYWHTLEDVLTSYVIHDDHKFTYTDNKAVRKHIIADRVRYIGKESNNLDETQVTGIDEDSYLEYFNSNAFKDWLLALKPKDVKDKGISERGLRNFRQKIREGKGLKNKSKIAKTLFECYKSGN